MEKEKLVHIAESTISYVMKELKKQSILLEAIKYDDDFSSLDIEKILIEITSVYSSQDEVTKQRIKEIED